MVSKNLSPEQHRRLHSKFTKVKYKPLSVSNVLKTIWSLSDIGLDLAFYAYFSKDSEAAERVLDINKIIDENLAQFIMHTSLAYGRTREGAEASLLAFYYGSAVDTIVDSVKDIVYTLLIGYTPGVSYEEIAPLMDGEIVAKLVVEKPVKVLDLTDAYPVDIVLSIHAGKWMLAPGPDTIIPARSTIYVRGYRENVLRLLNDHGVPLQEKLTGDELDQVLKRVIELKDYTRLMIDLAHYTLLEADPGVIEEVEDLEVYIDWRQLDTLNKLKEVSGKIDPDTFIGLSILLKELEDIADASNTISHIPSLLEELPEHYRDVFSKVFETVGERIKTVTLKREVSMDKVVAWLRKYGGMVLAVKIGDTWIAYPLAKNPALRPGDKLVIAYPTEFADEVGRLIDSQA